MRNIAIENEIKVVAFGITAEIIGSGSISVQNIEDTDELMNWLILEYPELGQVEVRIAVDKKIIQSRTKISGRAEVALLPPFSGG